jgi:hypothetical protein
MWTLPAAPYCQGWYTYTCRFIPLVGPHNAEQIVQVVIADLLPMHAVILGSHHATQGTVPTRCPDRQARTGGVIYRQGPNTVVDNDVRKSNLPTCSQGPAPESRFVLAAVASSPV